MSAPAERGPGTPSRRRPWLRWGLTAAAAVLLVLAARRVGWAETWATLRAASPALLAAAAALNLASLAARGARWWVFLRAAAAVRLGLAVRATVVGSGLNNLLVANGGEAARVLLVARQAGLRASGVLATLALERLCGLIGYAVLLVGATWHLPLPEGAERAKRWAALGLTVLAGMTAALLAWTPGDGERARRRAAQLGADERTVLAEQALRDERDSTRSHGPLAPAPDATVLDTSDLDIDHVVERIAHLIDGVH